RTNGNKWLNQPVSDRLHHQVHTCPCRWSGSGNLTKEILMNGKFLSRRGGGKKRSSTTGKLIATIAVLGAAASIAGLGTYATYTCGGSTSSVLASRAVIGSNLALSNLSSTTAGSTDHLRVTLTLPSGAGNTLQNQSSTISYAFTGTQRAATNK